MLPTSAIMLRRFWHVDKHAALPPFSFWDFFCFCFFCFTSHFVFYNLGVFQDLQFPFFLYAIKLTAIKTSLYFYFYFLRRENKRRMRRVPQKNAGVQATLSLRIVWLNSSIQQPQTTLFGERCRLKSFSYWNVESIFRFRQRNSRSNVFKSHIERYIARPGRAW